MAFHRGLMNFSLYASPKPPQMFSTSVFFLSLHPMELTPFVKMHFPLEYGVLKKMLRGSVCICKPRYVEPFHLFNYIFFIYVVIDFSLKDPTYKCWNLLMITLHMTVARVHICWTLTCTRLCRTTAWICTLDSGQDWTKKIITCRCTKKTVSESIAKNINMIAKLDLISDLIDFQRLRTSSLWLNWPVDGKLWDTLFN